MNLAIVDTEYTGHHLEYIYGICSQLIKKEEKPESEIYCSEEFFTYVGENNLKPISKESGVRFCTNRLKSLEGNWFRKKMIQYNNLKKLESYDHVIFLNLNFYLIVLLLYAIMNRCKFSFSGIYFNPLFRNERGFKSYIRDFALKYLCNTHKSSSFLILNDREAVKHLNNRYSTECFKHIVDPIPTFIYSDKNEEESYSCTDNQLTFLLIGTLSERKGIFQFLNAVEHSNSDNRFILAGKVKENISDRIENKVEYLNKKGFDIHLRNEFLTNEDFAQLVDQSNILVLPYLTKGASSGILGHAAYRKKPVIGPSEGLLSDLIEEYCMGVSIDPNDIAALSEYLNNGNGVIEVCDFEAMKEYFQNNSYEAFCTKLIFDQFNTTSVKDTQPR